MISATSQAVDVWTVRLDAPIDASRAFRALLSSEETARADRFVTQRLRTSYEIAHGALRVLLSQYLQCSPRELAFAFGRAGKPALRGDSRLRFNMSHSGGLAAYALTYDCQIGVDIEEVRAMPDIDAIAQRYFCHAEALELRSVPGGKQRDEAFFRCWTRKESYIKALGGGLSVPLDRFQVTLLCDSRPGLVHIEGDVGAASKWTMHHLDPAPGYIGAVAYRAGARRLTVHAPRQAHEILDLAP